MRVQTKKKRIYNGNSRQTAKSIRLQKTLYHNFIHNMEPSMDVVLLFLPFLIPFLIFLLWRLLCKKSTFSDGEPLNLPPGPWKFPIFGNIFQMVGSLPHHRLRDLAKKHGPVVHLQLGQVTTIVVSSPETAKEVMKTHDIFFCDRPSVFAINILTYGSADIVFAPYGEYWRQMKKICTLELLSYKRVQSYRPIREEEVSKFIRTISSGAGSSINLSSMLLSLSYCITARAAFGKKCKDQEAFISDVQKMLQYGGGFELVDLFPSLTFLGTITGLESRLKKLHQRLDMILESIITEHMMPKSTTEEEVDGFVRVLLNLQESRNIEIPLSANNIKGVIVDVFVAASETTSTTVEWSMSELMKNPRVMRKAQAEVREIFRKKDTVVETGLQELKYLSSVIKETMRLHPAVALLLPRECRERSKINGYDIPVKAKIIVNAWAIGRDPNYWSEPEKFFPERFMESSIDYKGTDFEFVPFGAGRRICPGISFAMASMEFQLANLLYHFDWQLPSGTQVEDLDMTEEFGPAVRRKHDLYLTPIPYHPLPE